MASLRPSLFLAVLLLFLIVVACWLGAGIRSKRQVYLESFTGVGPMVSSCGLSDLALTTEARYTRHPAVSDPVAPFMDHPHSLEHFPSGSFFTPPER